MKLQINSWQAVSTWTWNASDDTCGICRQAFDGLVKQRFGFTLLRFNVSFVLIMWTLSPSPSLTCCAAGAALTASFPAMIARYVRPLCRCHCTSYICTAPLKQTRPTHTSERSFKIYNQCMCVIAHVKADIGAQ